MKIRQSIRIIAVIVGIGLCTYPLLSSMLERINQKNAVATYESNVEKIQDSDIKLMFNNAREYNEALYQTKSSMVSVLRDGILTEKKYEELLNISGTGVMGSVEIPKISANLPIYHGTDEEVLSIGAGHLEGTSLPVGGKNTHCILTGHRGLPNSQLFTRLDELEKGDSFYVRVGDRTLAYEINKIQIIKPEDVEGLSIQEGKDQVSLITCTPYGINSHRLVVTGERTSYMESEHLSIEPQMASLREIVFIILPFLMIGILIVRYIKERKGHKRAK